MFFLFWENEEMFQVSYKSNHVKLAPIFSKITRARWLWYIADARGRGGGGGVPIVSITKNLFVKHYIILIWDNDHIFEVS